MKAEIRRIVGLLPLMLFSMALLSILVGGSGVLAYRSFQSPISTPLPTVPPSPTATAIPPTETPLPEETTMPSPTPTFEAAPPAGVASPIPSAEETPSHPSRSWADYIEIGLVALAYTWRALGVLAFIAFLGLIIFLAIGRWRS